MQEEADPFDQINQIQSQSYKIGYTKAKNDVDLEKNAEKKQNYSQGLATGKQLGLELGYYTGYIEELRQVLFSIEEYSKHSGKQFKIVDQLLGDIEGIILSISPESNSVDLDELPNTILILRNKFKTLMLSLGMKKPDFIFKQLQQSNQQSDNISFDF